ncbi:MAG: radical SAM protein [Pseudomonadota bacterium]
MQYNHIFGPVLSRRLGISLGVDLVVHKTCSLDCIYCECGKTTCLTGTQKEYVNLLDVKKELDHFWQNNDDPDYITFSGSGEPTLNPCLGQVIEYIKTRKPNIKVAVLTNATLFDDPRVRQALLKADRVAPSLDAATKEAFERINRPHKDVDLKKMIQGIQTFAKEYKGELFLEILILPGINNDLTDLLHLKEAIKKIKPDRVQINTLDRPGTLADIRPATKKELEQVIKILDYSPIEIIAKVKIDESIQAKVNRKDIKMAIVETIHRRPCTKKDLIQTFGADPETIDKYIEQLEWEKKIIGVFQERGMFYQTIKDPEKESQTKVQKIKK